LKTELIEVLVEAGVIPEASLQEKHDSKAPLLEILLSKGYGSEDDVIKILKNKLNYEVVENKIINNINLKILQSIPINFILEYHILPFMVDDNSLNIAMCDPSYDECINELAFLVDKHINVFVAKPSEINFNINKYFNVSLPTNFKHFKTSSKTTNVIPKPNNLPEINNISKLNEATKVVNKPSIPDPFSGTKTNIKIPETDLFDKTPMPKKPDFNPPSYEVKDGDISVIRSKKPDFTPNENKKNPNPFKIHPDDIENEIKNTKNVSKAYEYNNIEIDKELNDFDIIKPTQTKKYVNEVFQKTVDNSFIKYFEDQKNILELRFESKINELREKILKLEEDKNLSNIRKELEEKLEKEKTLEKIKELEKIKDHNELFLKLQNIIGVDKNQNNSFKSEFNTLQESILRIQEEQAILVKNMNETKNDLKKNDNKTNNDILDIKTNILNNNFYENKIHNERIYEDKKDTNFSLISKIDNLIEEDNNKFNKNIIQDFNKDIELEKFEKDHTVIEEILLESSYIDSKKVENINETTVIRNLKEEIDSIPSPINLKTNIGNAPDLNLDNMFVENININIKNILEAKTKDDLIQKSLLEIQKLSSKAIILFVRFENIIGISGIGDKVIENVNTYKDTILIPSMFKKVYDTKNTYTGVPTEDNIVKNFYLHFNMSRPTNVYIAPIMLKKRVFGMLYCEDVKEPDTLNKILKAMNTSFEAVFNK